MNFDDNALFRHKDIVAMRDLAEENPLEVEASKFNLNYIKLDGEIGCMVNGAGLAMATMDIIKLDGSSPANFLDVGGSASQEAVANAFRILISDPDVKAVLINIFGGIARTDRIASGVVAALRELGGVKIPVVVRLEGTNVEQGRRDPARERVPLPGRRDDGRRGEEGRRAVESGRCVMAIWLNKETRLVVQGITGKEGKFHALGCRDYGTQVVAGVTPGKGGETVEGIPVFDSVEEARQATGANAAMIFVPPPFAADAIMEAADAGIELVVAITEGIPVNDMIRVKAFLRGKPKTRLIGPNCPGIITPGRRRSASCRGTSTGPAGSASSRARERSPTRRSGS